MSIIDLDEYYDESVPPSVITGTATGATAGIPGTWTPAGSRAPLSLADVVNGNPTVVANPLTPWTTGQYVQTRTAGAAGRVTWSGTNWVGGAAPLDITALSIADVKAYIESLGAESDDAGIAETERVLDVERASGSPRSTLIAWLDARDGVT